MIVALYKGALVYLFHRLSSSADFNYGFFIPLIVAYILWGRRNRLATIVTEPSLWSVLIWIFGIAVFWLGELGGEFYTIYISFMLLLIGGILGLYGWRMLKGLSFSLLILFFMFPLPSFAVQIITFKLRLLSSILGVHILRSLGYSVFREGNIIDIGITQLHVGDACSGLRYVFPLIVLALLVGYFTKLRFCQRLALFLSSVPLAIISNGVRIALAAILYWKIGERATEGLLHDLEGLFVFIFSFILLEIEVLILKRLGRGINEKASARGPFPPHFQTSSVLKMGIIYGVMLVMAGSSCLAYYLVDFREKVPLVHPLSKFPDKIGPWTGKRDYLDPKVIGTLNLSSYVIYNYNNSAGKVVNFYVAYYESQRKGESIHTPATCLRAGGWVFKDMGTLDVNVPCRGRIGVRRAILLKPGKKEVLFYWFQKSGRIIDNVFLLKWYVFCDAITRHRTDGALVRIVTPVYPGEKPDREPVERLRSFMQVAVPVLDSFLPN